MMTPFEAYKLFLAIKMHFTQPQYDFFKYNGKVNATIQSFEKRRDKFHFAKLAKHKDPISYLVAHYISGNFTGWVGDLFGEDSERIYTQYLARHQSLSYNFQSELDKLSDDFLSHFKVKDGQHPPLLVALKRGGISIETFTILNDQLNYFSIWNNKIDDTVLWPSIRDKSLKYLPFIHYDRKRIKAALKDILNVQRSS